MFPEECHKELLSELAQLSGDLAEAWAGGASECKLQGSTMQHCKVQQSIKAGPSMATVP